MRKSMAKKHPFSRGQRTLPITVSQEQERRETTPCNGWTLRLSRKLRSFSVLFAFMTLNHGDSTVEAPLCIRRKKLPDCLYKPGVKNSETVATQCGVAVTACRSEPSISEGPLVSSGG